MTSGDESLGFTPLASPLYSAQILPLPRQPLSAESICEFPLLNLFVDDYFTYIHPLVPVPHEPSFRKALAQRADTRDRTFLALLAAMIGCLTVSFPRRPRRLLRAHKKTKLFPNMLSLVERCHYVCAEARGTGFFHRDLTVYDAATSYLVGLASAYIFKLPQGQLYFGECLTILRTLGLHRSINPDTGMVNSPNTSASEKPEPRTNHVLQEMGRRTFWVAYVSAKSMIQLGQQSSDIFVPSAIPVGEYPELPAEVDDCYIFEDRIEEQPREILSELVGFNTNVRIFRSYDPLSIIDVKSASGGFYMDWRAEKDAVRRCLWECKQTTKDIPEELLLPQPCQKGAFGANQTCSTFDCPQSRDGIRIAPSESTNLTNMDPSRSLQERRNIQCNIQTANIHISHLGTRFHIIDRYWRLCQSYHHTRQPKPNYPREPQVPTQDLTLPGIDRIDQMIGPSIDYKRLPYLYQDPKDLPNDEEMEKEPVLVLRDLFVFINSIRPVSMEPNGGSIVSASILPLPIPRRNHSQSAALQVSTKPFSEN